MQNSEAVQAWFQGKMASFRILGLVSKNEIRSREFSFSSRCLRVKIINLDLVSMPKIGGNFFSVSSRSLRVSVRNSRSRLDERDWIRETLILVSRMKKWLSLTSAAWPGPNWPKMPILGQIWSFLGKKSFFFTGEIKSFVTYITENPPRHLVHIGFWSGIGQNVQ